MVFSMHTMVVNKPVGTSEVVASDQTPTPPWLRPRVCPHREDYADIDWYDSNHGN